MDEADVRYVHFAAAFIDLVLLIANDLPHLFLRAAHVNLVEAAFFHLFSNGGVTLGDRNLFVQAVLFVLQLFDAVFHHKFLDLSLLDQ